MNRWRCSLVLLVVLAALAGALPAGAQTGQVVYSTGQYFQNGVMLWHSDTGHIWVIANNGQVLNFPASSYASLPDNRDTANGPLFGFGKVWSNFPQVRDLLGPPVYFEVGFYMRIQSQNGVLYLTQSNGIIYQINPDGTWVYAQQPPVPNAIIVSFTSDVTAASTGDPVTLRWEVYGVDHVQLEASNPDTSKLVARVSYLPQSGSHTFTIPPGLAATGLDFVLAAVRVTITDPGGAVYERVDQAMIPVQIVAPSINENSPGVTFQTFERGFMIWRADTADIYVLLDSGTLDTSGGRLLIYPHRVYSGWPSNSMGPAPTGRVRPEMGFGQVWAHEWTVRDALGWATRPEQGHLANARAENGVPVSITVPGGDTILLNSAAGRWRWLDS